MPHFQSGFTDKDRINDMLSCEKFLSSNWSTAANEMVQQELFQDTMQFLNETHNAQRQLFQVMQQKGWYQTDQANQQQISQTASQYSQKTQPEANRQFQSQY
ncbi:MAG: spore coat protein [Firmicutes bacterium]|nr:spore coat protein [Bacillota bacterium]MDD4264518.1 spore coat protein [Bacillota bacterium]MDD4692894.1 spore coat protein [Bacillota bacterium]